MAGQEHAILFDGQLEEGRHEIRFRGEGLEDGAYSCVVIADKKHMAGHFRLIKIGGTK